LEQTRYTPMIGKFKVFVVDEVHMLSKSAFNALLKTLEEPPAHVIFIFATTEVNKVPATILSRVQRFDFKRIGSRLIADRLHFICTQENIVDDPDALAIISDKADGSMRDALTYFDQVYAFSGSQMTADAARKVLGVPPQSLYLDLVSAIFDHDQKKCFELVDQACNMGIELSVFLDGFSRFLRNLLYARVSGLTAEALEITDVFYQQLQAMAPDASNGDVLRLSKIVSDTQSQIKGASSPRLLVETALARMAWLDRVADLKKIIAGLENPGSPEVVKKKILRSAPATAPEPLIAVPPPSAPQASTVPLSDAMSAQGDEEIVISFEEEGSQSQTPTVTKFEIVSQWRRVQKDFCQVEPLAAAYLEGSTLQRGDFQSTPFPLRILFSAEQSFQHQQITQSPAYARSIQEYLEMILQTRVDLRIEIAAANPQTQASVANQARPVLTTPAASFERDKEREPILAFLAETFETTWVATKTLRHSNDVTALSAPHNDDT